MDAPPQNKPFAWQPLTPGGVAAFATASLSRLFTVQLVVALLAAAAVVWFLQAAWFPLVTAAIRQLPDQGRIRAGQLEWPGSSPVVLAQGHFLALTVDLNHEGEARSPAHLQVEFGRADFKIFSLLGYLQGQYPRRWSIAFNRPELLPWWGAWSPALLALAAGATITGLLLVWAVLATVYSVPAWLLAFFADRELRWRGSWRLAGAALLPGALLMTGAILLYGLGGLDLVQLAFTLALHLLVGWAYLFASPFWLPRHPGAPGVAANPFTKA